jgi:hypothetical protein
MDGSVVAAGATGVAEVLVPTGIMVGVDVLKELVCDGEEPWSEFNVHVVPPVHEYPNGQHPLAQGGRVPERLVV